MPRPFYKKAFPALLAPVLLAALAAGYVALQMQRLMQTPVQLEEAVSLTLAPGSSIHQLGRQLRQHGLLDEPRYLYLWARLHHQARRLQAGEYRLASGDTLAVLLDRMARGEVVQYRFTLVEGQTFAQTLQRMQQSPLLTHTLNGLSPEAIMQRLGHAGEHPEGRFFPDTYFISRGVRDIELLRRAYQRMQQVLAQEWARRAPDLPLETPYAALILASIVEKETADPAERPLIAGVFINRLRKHMRLQTDPSVIYGIAHFDGNIRRRDLRADTPYNTYTRHGLPPTPIALPGREAIHAVLHPARTDKLYFVACGDGSGRHVFSATLKAHEKAVDRHQRHRRGKAPECPALQTTN